MLEGYVTLPFTVAYSTADGTATAASGDYAPRSGTLTFGPSIRTQFVYVPVNPDLEVEPSETFFLNLSDPTGGVQLALPRATVTVGDGEPPTLRVLTVDVTEPELESTSFGVPIELTQSPLMPVIVDYVIESGSARLGVDFEAISGQLTFQPGAETVQYIDVRVFADAMDEGSERFYVRLSNPRGAVLRPSRPAGAPVDGLMDGHGSVVIKDRNLPL
jgi:hypothetical protein